MLQLPSPAWYISPRDRFATTLQTTLGRIFGVRRGRIELIGGDARRVALIGERPGRTIDVRVRDWKSFVRRAAGGQAGLAQAYMDGVWDCDDLAALIAQCLSRTGTSGGLLDSGWVERFRRGGRRHPPNTRAGSSRNIHAHYDLGDTFFEAWLDPGMTYSAAIFSDPGMSLEDAQDAKYGRILETVRPRADQHILEIGCGWGGFMEHAARAGLRVTGLTISRAQHDYVARRMAAAGLGDRATVRLLDYRDVSGRYDAIVSIEMIEAVGEEFWPDYFSQIRRCLARDGRALIQAITIDDRLIERYRREDDFIRSHIFPGGLLISPNHFQAEAAGAGLRLVGTSTFGRDYARTLACWGDRFRARARDIRELGFDERFIRMWRLYLAACQAGFERGPIDVGHYLLERDPDLEVT